MTQATMNKRDPGARARLYSLGTALLFPGEYLDIIAAELEPEDFDDPKHRIVYEVMTDIWRVRGRMEPEDLLGQMLKDERIEPVRDVVEYLLDWGTRRDTPEGLVAIVKDSRKTRAIAQRLSEYAEEALNTHERPTEFASRLIADLSDYAIGGNHSGLIPLIDVGKEWLESTKVPLASSCVPTGFQSVDHLLTGGFRAGSLNTIAGKPGAGKTALALYMAVHAAKQNKQVAFFSLEMTRSELFGRILSAATSINANIIARRIRSKNWNEDERRPVLNTWGELSELPFEVDDTGGISLAEVGAKCRRAKARGSLDLVVVDYLQLMGTVGRGSRTRSEEVGALSRGLKTLAKELHVAVLMLSQLNRQSTTEKPAMHHLRDSGEIEQDSDFIGYLWQNSSREDSESIIELHILKQRSGPAGVMVPLYFAKHITRFSEAEMHDQPPREATELTHAPISWSADSEAAHAKKLTKAEWIARMKRRRAESKTLGNALGGVLR